MRTIKEQIEIAMFLTILIVLEYLMAFLPNISLTPLIFAVFFFNRTIAKSTVLIFTYIIMQGLIWGFSIYLIPMFLGWTIWMWFVKNMTDYGDIMIFSIMFGFIYGWVFMPFSVFLYGINMGAYLVADFPFQVTMALSTVFTMMLLFTRLSTVFKLITEKP